jgi:peptide/nickel transport system ATP-binding protein
LSTLLSVENLKVSIQNPETGGEGWVLRGIDFQLREAERLAVVGESGCGKSVTALSLLGLLPDPPMRLAGGRILFKNRDLVGLSPAKWKGIRGKEIGIVFQDPLVSLNPVLTVGDQIEETLQFHLGLGKGQARERTLQLLAEVRLPDPPRIAEQYPHQLSGGMCQRVMIAMAVACGPSLLIADEPTTALDVTVQTQILDLLFRMTEKHGLAVLFITHNLRIVRSHADRISIFYAGRVLEEGAPARLFDHPQHPYTEGLLAALPEAVRAGQKLESIPGTVPSPFDPLRGCVYADRCGRVREKCRAAEPELLEIQEGHKVRCFYPSKK